MNLADDIKRARRVYLCGNGGSAANANHITNDLVLSCGIDAESLCANVASLTAAANDCGYYKCFSKQIERRIGPGDLLIILSGSGRSPNTHIALEVAKARGARTYAILGARAVDSPAAKIADVAMCQGSDMQAAEEAQLEIGHELMRILRCVPSE